MRSSSLLFILTSLPYLCSAEPAVPNNIPELINSARTLRKLMQSDPHRPIYHFVAPEGQIIDPNGALYWKGKYHLGPIYVKLDGKEHLVWGHAVSTDLLHWTQYPDMIDVTEGGGETDIYSGGTFLSREGVPHVIYYSAGTASNRIAYATDDDLKVWKKFKGNPALKPEDPNDPNGAGYCCVLPKGKYSVWDPEAWYDNKSDYYYQISGGMKPALFKSEDMHQWEYLGPVISGNNTMRHPFEDISCPEFFSLGEKSMLLFISHTLGAQYYIGTFANEKFTPEQHGRMNWPGGTFFAPEQLRDAKGRNIIWGWVTEFHRPSHLPAYGWSGIMSLPRVVSLSGKVTLEVNPPEEIQAIRLNEVREDDVIVQPNTETTLQAQGKSIEVKLEVASGVRSPFGVKVFASPDGREETVIRYEPDRDQLVIDFVRSSVRGPVSIPFFIMPERFYPKMFNPETYDFYRQNVSKKVSEQRAPLKLEEGETLKLDIFLDRSIIEVFANGRQVVTQIVYPELDTSTGVKVFSGKEAITVKNIQSWTMAETGPY